jgi:hypothetical protein
MKASPGRRPGSIPGRCGSVSQREAEFQAADFIMRLVLPDRPDNDVGNPEGGSAYANNRACGRDAEPCADFGFVLRTLCRVYRCPDIEAIHYIENIGADERCASADSESRAQGFLVLGILEVLFFSESLVSCTGQNETASKKKTRAKAIFF